MIIAFINVKGKPSHRLELETSELSAAKRIILERIRANALDDGLCTLLEGCFPTGGVTVDFMCKETPECIMAYTVEEGWHLPSPEPEIGKELA